MRSSKHTLWSILAFGALAAVSVGVTAKDRPPGRSGEPGPGMYLTCDDSGRFYTTDSVWGDQPKHYLASMAFSQGRFSRPERLAIRPHYENQTHPCIAPDGSYILFDIIDFRINKAIY